MTSHEGEAVDAEHDQSKVELPDQEQLQRLWDNMMSVLPPEDQKHLENEADGASVAEKFGMLQQVEQILAEEEGWHLEFNTRVFDSQIRRFSNLQEVVLQGARLFSPGIERVANALHGNPHISSVNLANNSMTRFHDETRFESYHEKSFRGVIALGGAIRTMQSLTVLDISRNGLYSRGVWFIAHALRDNQTITDLNLAVNSFMSSHNEDVSGVLALSETLPTMGTLTSLNVRKNKLGMLILPDRWTTIFQVRTDYISGYKRDDGKEQTHHPGKPEGAIAFLQAIRRMAGLTSLSLGRNDLLHPMIGECFAEILHKPSALTTLGLSWNHPIPFGRHVSPQTYVPNGPGFAKALAVGLANNNTLTHLDLEKCIIRTEGCIAVANALMHNNTLERLDISSNCVSKNDAVVPLYSLHGYVRNEASLTPGATLHASGILAIVKLLSTMNALKTLKVLAPDSLMKRNNKGIELETQVSHLVDSLHGCSTQAALHAYVDLQHRYYDEFMVVWCTIVASSLRALPSPLVMEIMSYCTVERT